MISMKEAWRKNVILFLTSQTISLFGSSLVQYAIMWFITLETRSGIMMTMSIIFGFVPTFFLSPFAGVWADRYNRKFLIIFSDSMIAVATLILAICFLLGFDILWLLFTITAIRAFGSGIQTPAVNAFLPQLVPEDKLSKINGLNGTIQALIMLISPMLSGALLAMTSIESIFLIDVVTASIAVFIMAFFLKVPAHKKASQKQESSYFTDLQVGFYYIKNHPYVKRFFTFCIFFFILVVPVAFLTPLQVTRSFGGDVWRLTAIEVAFSAGMLGGGILMTYWKGLDNKIHTMAFSTLLTGACTFALGCTSVFGVYLVFMVLAGISMPVFNTPSYVLLQEKVEGDYLGRVFGVLNMISSITMPLGMLIYGPLSDMILIEIFLIVTGFLLFVQGIYLFCDKVLIQAGKPVELNNN